ncbi:MAG: 3'-5' exoribonuclease YhaM family protein [Candidatus Zipacnadales bacterium]
MNKQLVADLVANTRIDSPFAVRACSLASFRNKPGHYLNLILADRSGQIAGRAWDNAEALAEVCQPGTVVKVQGRVETYQGKLQIIVESAEVCPRSQVDPSDFLPASTRNPEGMLEEIDAAIAEVTNPHLQALLQTFFGDADFRRRFAYSAGAKSLHHSFISGLLEHTVSVLRILRCLQASHPQLDQDLLIAGALLHDIGKIEELVTDTIIEYTDTGRLLGHTVLTDRMIRARLADLPDFPRPLEDRLMHMLLSHHGRPEYGAPIVPMTAEACALHYADNLDAHVQYFSQVVQEGRESGNRWSDYQRLFDRYIFIGEGESSDDESGTRRE